MALPHGVHLMHGAWSLCRLAGSRQHAAHYLSSQATTSLCPVLSCMWAMGIPVSPFTPPAGRRLRDDITSNPSFKWAMIAIGCLLGVLLLVGLGFLIYYMTKKKDNKVQPEGAGKVIKTVGWCRQHETAS